MKKVVSIFSLCFLMGFAQLSFARNGHELINQGNTHTIIMAWDDMYGQSFRANFTLRTDDLRQSNADFGTIDKRDVQEYIYKKVQAYLAQKNSYRATVNAQKINEGIRYTATGSSSTSIKKLLSDVQKKQDEYHDEYLKLKFYMRLPKHNYIMADHARIAKRYVPAMRPVAQSLAKNLNTNDARTVTNYVLNFLQAIPYNTLTARSYDVNGAGFHTPYMLLASNKGDCDTKSVAFVSIMRNYYPNTRMLIVYVPGHTLVGFNFAQGRGDHAIQVNGSTFVLAEPVGPALSPLGRVSSNAYRYLERGEYSYQEVPF